MRAVVVDLAKTVDEEQVQADLAEEIDGEQVNLYLLTKQVIDPVSIDTIWDKIADREPLLFSNWDLEAEFITLTEAFEIDSEQVEIYYAQKIYHHKLKNNSFADPRIAKACTLLIEAFG